MRFKLIIIIINILVIFALSTNFLLAQTQLFTNMEKINKPAMDTSQAAGINVNVRIQDILSLAIKAFLSLLGAIFIILMVYAGYVWMMAHGNEEEVTKAKRTIQRAIIGLIIVVSAYAITYFIFNALNSTGGGGG